MITDDVCLAVVGWWVDSALPRPSAITSRSRVTLFTPEFSSVEAPLVAERPRCSDYRISQILRDSDLAAVRLELRDPITLLWHQAAVFMRFSESELFELVTIYGPGSPEPVLLRDELVQVPSSSEHHLAEDALAILTWWAAPRSSIPLTVRETTRFSWTRSGQQNTVASSDSRGRSNWESLDVITFVDHGNHVAIEFSFVEGSDRWHGGAFLSFEDGCLKMLWIISRSLGPSAEYVPTCVIHRRRRTCSDPSQGRPV